MNDQRRRRLLFLGGNGHCAARLAPARRILERLSAKGEIPPFDLVEIPYPGFEDRACVADFDAFLTEVSEGIAEAFLPNADVLLYGTGIGGLLALCLRARGHWLDTPLLLQAPVLWGLEHRLMPRLMRMGSARFLLRPLFSQRWFQRRFVRKQFERPMTEEQQEAFFAGYDRCLTASNFFTWLSPALLRQLEEQFTARPAALKSIGVWWGGHDRVVNLQELAWTEQALPISWLLRIFPTWGHYPMVDEPEAWVRALSDVLAAPDSIPGPQSPQAR